MSKIVFFLFPSLLILLLMFFYVRNNASTTKKHVKFADNYNEVYYVPMYNRKSDWKHNRSINYWLAAIERDAKEAGDLDPSEFLGVADRKMNRHERYIKREYCEPDDEDIMILS